MTRFLLAAVVFVVFLAAACGAISPHSSGTGEEITPPHEPQSVEGQHHQGQQHQGQPGEGGPHIGPSDFELEVSTDFSQESDVEAAWAKAPTGAAAAFISAAESEAGASQEDFEKFAFGGGESWMEEKAFDTKVKDLIMATPAWKAAADGDGVVVDVVGTGDSMSVKVRAATDEEVASGRAAGKNGVDTEAVASHTAGTKGGSSEPGTTPSFVELRANDVPAPCTLDNFAKEMTRAAASASLEVYAANKNGGLKPMHLAGKNFAHVKNDNPSGHYPGAIAHAVEKAGHLSDVKGHAIVLPDGNNVRLPMALGDMSSDWTAATVLLSGTLPNNKKVLIAAVRGSASVTDFIQDARCGMTPFAHTKGSKSKKYQAHKGFASLAMLAKPILAEIKKVEGSFDEIIFTGHSLGGAVASLLAVQYYHSLSKEMGGEDQKPALITFGQPRPGNKHLADLIEASTSTYVRMANELDPVPYLPTDTSLFMNFVRFFWKKAGGKYYHAKTKHAIHVKPGDRADAECLPPSTLSGGAKKTKFADHSMIRYVKNLMSLGV